MSEIITFDDYASNVGNDEWFMEIDISSEWNKYSNGELSLKDFCLNYKNKFLNKQNDIISKFGQEQWDKLNELLIKLDTIEDEEASVALFDDIYDWADHNFVLIKTNTESEIF